MGKQAKSAKRPESQFEQHAPDLQQYLFRFLKNRQDAEDVGQEVFARLSRIPDPQLARDPKAYLFGVAFHVLHEFRVRERRERVSYDSEVLNRTLENPGLLQPDELADQLSLQQQLEQALKQLPPKERAVLLLVKRDGLSYEEAAEAAQLSVHQVERYVAAARVKLKLMLWGE